MDFRCGKYDINAEYEGGDKWLKRVVLLLNRQTTYAWRQLASCHQCITFGGLHTAVNSWRRLRWRWSRLVFNDREKGRERERGEREGPQTGMFALLREEEMEITVEKRL